MEQEIKKTIAKILDLLDISDVKPQLKTYIKNELWDMSDRLLKIAAESKNGNTK